MSRRSPAGTRRTRLWVAIGSLMVATMLSTAPSRAAEPDRQDQPLVCAKLSPGKPFSLIPRGDNRVGRSGSDNHQGIMGHATPPRKETVWEALFTDRDGCQTFTLSHIASIISLPTWRASLLGAGVLRTKVNPVNEDVSLFALPAMPGAMTGAEVGPAVRTPLRAISPWARVVVAAELQVEAMTRCNPEQDDCPAEVLRWQELLREARELPLLEQLQTVNAYFNRWPYRLDIDTYGASEYWATPQEFLRQSGDCEDYCITKYFALKQLGVPVEWMNIVLLIDTINNIPHAVLAVRCGQDSYLLDNLSDLLLPYQSYTHLQPLYSVNEHYRWAYIASGPVR